ncbi:MAG: FecR domain-containing protein [Bacteroidota bacterium]
MSKKMQKRMALYLTKEGSALDLDLLSQWVEDTENRTEFLEYIKINYAVGSIMNEFGKEDSKKKLLDYIERDKKKNSNKKVFSLTKYAATVLLLIGLAYCYKKGYFDGENDSVDRMEVVSETPGEEVIRAGSDKAVLTLGNGSVIHLEKGKEVQTAHLRSNGEQLVYNRSKNSESYGLYNYLTIPRGGQFQIKLADGSLVWLNSESQLKYPVEFPKGEAREVELVYGEAYFDVSPSTEHQGAIFKVINQSQEIEVLGTEFNLKAYKGEENVCTTLVEGEVVVRATDAQSILEPGQQSVLNLDKGTITKRAVAVDNEILWVKGIFSFHNMPLKDIAQVISRWYDVDVLFADPVLENAKFNGVFRKDEPLDEILESIVITKSIKAYDVAGRRITIK